MTRGTRKARVHSRPGSGGSRNWLYFVLALATTLAVGLGTVLATVGGPSQPGTGPTASTSLPDWLARAPALVKEAYAYAADHPETMGYIPCYCGCGQHSGHRSAHDCFVAARAGSRILYDEHGANCDMCVDIALMTKRTLTAGGSLRDARLAVDKKYSSLGPGTDTPPLP